MANDTKKPAPKATKPAAKKPPKETDKTIEKPVAKKAAPKKTTSKKSPVKKAVNSASSAKKTTAKTSPEQKSTSISKGKQKAVSSAPAEKKETPSPKIAVARRPVRKQPIRKKGMENYVFKVKEVVVYPAHGVGTITSVETQSIAEMEIELYVINFEHEKMKLRVPTERAVDSGMRPLSTNEEVDKAIVLLQGRARVKRTMWSRRAQEYEAKINSGDLRSVAEVVRDLYRSPEQPDQSYSERQLFESAVDRMAREVAAVRKVDHAAAVREMDASLQKKQIAA